LIFGTEFFFSSSFKVSFYEVTNKILFLKHKKSSFTTYNLHSSLFGSGSEPIIRIRILQKGSDPFGSVSGSTTLLVDKSLSVYLHVLNKSEGGLQDNLHLATPEGGAAHLHQFSHVAQLCAQLSRCFLAGPGGELAVEVGGGGVEKADPVPAFIFPSPPVY